MFFTGLLDFYGGLLVPGIGPTFALCGFRRCDHYFHIGLFLRYVGVVGEGVLGDLGRKAVTFFGFFLTHYDRYNGNSPIR